MNRTETWECAEAAAYDVAQTHLPEYVDVDGDPDLVGTPRL